MGCNCNDNRTLEGLLTEWLCTQESSQTVNDLIAAVAKEATLLSIRNKMPNLSVTRNRLLSASLTALTTETCISVTLRNNGNSLIFTSGGSTDEQTLMANEVVTLFVSNANLISVSGTGTLGYIVDKL